MLGPYIKSRGTGGTKMSKNADFITVEPYVQGENNWNTSFSYISQNIKKLYILSIWGSLGGGGGFNDQTGPVLLASYPLTHIYVHVK